MKHFSLQSVVVGLIFCLIFTPSSSTAQETPPISQIAFVGQRPDGASSDIFLINADGTGLLNLTDTPDAEEIEPDWSPDGTHLLYIAQDKTGQRHIMLLEVSTGTRQPLITSDWKILEVQWSPNGQHIAFFGTITDRRLDYYLMDADGANLRNLTEDSRLAPHDRSFVWLPSGDTIVFAEDIDYYWLLDVATSELTPVFEDIEIRWPTWSPDGSRMVYTTQNLGVSWNLIMANANGSNATALVTQGFLDGIGPAIGWSPDSQSVVFDGNTVNFLHLLNTNTGQVRQLTSQTSDSIDFDWSPDSTALVYEGWDNFSKDLYVIDVSGATPPQQLTFLAGEEFSPRWRPAGNSVGEGVGVPTENVYIHPPQLLPTAGVWAMNANMGAGCPDLLNFVSPVEIEGVVEGPQPVTFHQVNVVVTTPSRIQILVDRQLDEAALVRGLKTIFNLGGIADFRALSIEMTDYEGYIVGWIFDVEGDSRTAAFEDSDDHATITLEIVSASEMTGMVQVVDERGAMICQADYQMTLQTAGGTNSPSGGNSTNAPASPVGCTVTSANAINRRSGPGTDFAAQGQLTPGEIGQVVGQTTGADGQMWWQLTDNSWVRSDVVTENDACASVPFVTP